MMTAEELLRAWRTHCSMRSRMHHMSRGRYRVANYALSIASIALTAFAGLATISVTAVEVEGGSRHLHSSEARPATSSIVMLAGALSIVATSLTAIHKLVGVAELQMQHELYSDMYDQLSKEIDLQIVLDRDDRTRVFVSLNEFLKHCKARMDTIVERAPAVSSSVARRIAASSD